MYNSDRPIIVDSDALIAVVDLDDALHTEAIKIAYQLRDLQVTLLYPATTIAEAATTFQRKLNKPLLVAQVVAALKSRQFLIEPVDDDVLQRAAELLRPHGSKKNTMFDAIVAAVAQKHQAEAVFAFDDWYQKVGLRLISEVL